MTTRATRRFLAAGVVRPTLTITTATTETGSIPSISGSRTRSPKISSTDRRMRGRDFRLRPARRHRDAPDSRHSARPSASARSVVEARRGLRMRTEPCPAPDRHDPRDPRPIALGGTPRGCLPADRGAVTLTHARTSPRSIRRYRPGFDVLEPEIAQWGTTLTYPRQARWANPDDHQETTFAGPPAFGGQIKPCPF